MARSNIKAVFENDVQTVWNVITDVKNYIWRTDLSKTEIISDKQFIEYTKNVSAKYCYAAHESRLHQNDRCKRFALCLVLTVRFRSLAPWGKLFQLFI